MSGLSTSTALNTTPTCIGYGCAGAGVAVVGTTAVVEGTIALTDSYFWMIIVNFVLVAIILGVLFGYYKWQVALPKKLWSAELDAGQFWFFVLALWLLFFTFIGLIIKIMAYKKNSDKLNYDAYLEVLVPSSPVYLAIAIIIIILICVSAACMAGLCK